MLEKLKGISSKQLKITLIAGLVLIGISVGVWLKFYRKPALTAQEQLMLRRQEQTRKLNEAFRKAIEEAKKKIKEGQVTHHANGKPGHPVTPQKIKVVAAPKKPQEAKKTSPSKPNKQLGR